jgi:hypothetical protein
VAIAFVWGGMTIWMLRRRPERAPLPALVTGVVHSDVVQGDHCPVLTSWVISPLQTSSPRGVISVAAAASDADAGDRLMYDWTATAGSFTDPRAFATHYTCTKPGEQTLTFRVSDDHHPEPCSSWVDVSVNCVQ